MLVSQILKSKSDDAVVTSLPSMLISEAAKLLSEKRIGTLVISSDGQTPDGILSERDIVRELGRQGAQCLPLTVDKLMTTKLVTCGRDDRADEILKKMTEGRFRHMPVLDEGKLVGLISLGDVVKARLSELAMEKDALEGMIIGALTCLHLSAWRGCLREKLSYPNRTDSQDTACALAFIPVLLTPSRWGISTSSVALPPWWTSW